MSVYGTFCIHHYSRCVHVLTFVLLFPHPSCLLSHGAVPSAVLEWRHPPNHPAQSSLERVCVCVHPCRTQSVGFVYALEAL